MTVGFIRNLSAPAKPIIKRFYGLRAFGPFHEWNEASRSSSGYDTQEIIESTFKATLQAKIGGYTPHPATERILNVVHQLRPKRVMDFGGAMGKYYFILKAKMPEVHWDVVELPITVQFARNLEEERLHFHYSTSSVLNPDLIVVSGALQYCESPTDILTELRRFGVPIFLDRLPILSSTCLGVQIVTKPFRAQFPIWFLSRADIGDFLLSWDCGESIWLNGRNITYKGFLITPREGSKSLLRV